MPKNLAAIALLVIAPAGARAFQEPALFDVLPTPVTGGAGSVHFTGSPASRWYSCAICHQSAAGQIGLKWSSNPADLQQGNYTPGTNYTITLVMTGEHLGLDHPTTNCTNLGLPGQPTCNWNGVVAEIVDANGNPAGQLCPEVIDRRTRKQQLCTTTNSAVLSADTSQVIGQPSQYGGDTQWSFVWESPSTQIPVTLYAAVVDGNGGGPAAGGAPPHDGLSPDVDGDDVATLVLTLGPPSPTVATTCGYGGAWPGIAVGFLVLPFRRRRRR